MHDRITLLTPYFDFSPKCLFSCTEKLMEKNSENRFGHLAMRNCVKGRWRRTVTLGQRKSKSFSSSMYGKRKKNGLKFSIFRILCVQRSYISTLPRLPLVSAIYKCQPTSSSKSSLHAGKKNFKVSQINYFSLFITKINNFFRFSAQYSRTHASLNQYGGLLTQNTIFFFHFFVPANI